MNKILYKLKDGKPGFWLMRDVPQKPIRSFDAAHYFSAEHQYKDALCEYDELFEQCKANALEIVNPELIYGLMKRYTYPEIKDGDTFDLEGLEFKEEEHCTDDNRLCGEQCKDCPFDAKKVIRLIPKTETQDELIGEIWKTYFPEANISQNKVDDIKSKFTIKRNPTP